MEATGDPHHRCLKEVLADAALTNKHVRDPKKRAALEALAHLSYLWCIDLAKGEPLRLAREYLKLCRSALEREADHKTAADLYIGLTGLANLTKSSVFISEGKR